MNKLMRLARLYKLVEAANGEVDGRKKLHKLVYLCQCKGTDLGQVFQFHMYGVYSPSLAQDVEACITWELLKEKWSGTSYKISLPDTQADKFDPSIEDESNFSIVEQLADESPYTLEVLSTIVYLKRLGLGEIDMERALLNIKGHLKSHFDAAYSLANEHFSI